MNECVFCKIVNGEIPCYKVWEDENVLAFLDINPMVNGHILVVSKKHSDDIFVISDEDLRNMIVACKEVGNLLKKNFGAGGINIVSNSGKAGQQEINHMHFHILPRFDGDGRNLYLHGEKNINKNFEDVLSKIKGE